MKKNLILIPVYLLVCAFLTAACESYFSEKQASGPTKYIIRVENSEAQFGQNFMYDSAFVFKNKLKVGKKMSVEKFFQNDYPEGVAQKNDTLKTDIQEERLTKSDKLNETSLIIDVKITEITKLEGYSLKK